MGEVVKLIGILLIWNKQHNQKLYYISIFWENGTELTIIIKVKLYQESNINNNRYKPGKFSEHCLNKPAP